MKKIFYILIILLLIFSCEKRDDCDPNNPSLIGTWTWIKSVGGIGGGTITAEMTGEKIVISFSSDSVFVKTLNGNKIAESEFSISYDSRVNKSYIDYPGMINQYFEFQDCNNLILTDIAADGYKRYYKRK